MYIEVRKDKPHLGQFKTVEIIQSMFFDFNHTKLEINTECHQKNPPKYLEMKTSISNS